MSFREQFIKECFSVLKRDDVKDEVKRIVKPLIDMLLLDIYPYIYISLIFVSISFLLILAIFVLILRKKTILT